MASINAENAAKEMLRIASQGKKIVKKDVLVSVGYAQNTADSPKQVTETKTFKSVIKPVIEQLEGRRQAAIKRLTNKKLDKASALQTASTIDILTKNIQLLSGDPTEITKNKEYENLAHEIKTLIEEVKK